MKDLLLILGKKLYIDGKTFVLSDGTRFDNTRDLFNYLSLCCVCLKEDGK